MGRQVALALAVLAALSCKREPAAPLPVRVAVRHKTSLVSPLPRAYRDEIAAIPGVKAVAPVILFGTRPPVRPAGKGKVASLGVDPTTFLEVFPDVIVAPEAIARWKADERSAVVGDALADQLGIKTGDTIALAGDLYAGELAVRVAGTYEVSSPAFDRTSVLFRAELLHEQRPDRVSWFFALIDPAADADKVAAQIDAHFRGRGDATLSVADRAAESRR